MFIMLLVLYVANNCDVPVQKDTLRVLAVAMSKAEKYDHAPNMAALQTYQTSFATGDLDKLIEVMVSFECSLMQSSLCPSLMRMPQDFNNYHHFSMKDVNYSYTSTSQPGHKGIWETSVITK